MHENEISEKIRGAAIEVHRILGPGFLESVSIIDKPRLLTYLKLSGCHLGLIINFHEELLRSGVHRVVNNLKEQD
ncbi:hypothetical protein JXJ21_17115 [candidate division KSB1 bacterium]|nr:hypothetical protein [candidate division KSB1 bacterium]